MNRPDTSVPDAPGLSIIIVNWNTRDLLRDCLNSVYAETEATSFEVLVVDNASSDGSAEMVKREFPQVRLIENEENLGLARANNQAIRQSRGSYILLLNPDTVILSGALDKMVAFMRAHPDVDASGPMMLTADGSPHPPPKNPWYIFNPCLRFLFEGCLPVYMARRLVTRLGKRETYSSLPRPVSSMEGTCILMTSGALDKVGLLDEQYFLFAEETDWFYRLKQQGGKTYFFPEARIIHYWHQGIKQNHERVKHAYQSNYLFAKKHHTKMEAILFRLMVAIDSFVVICGLWVLQAIVRGNKHKQLNWRLRCRWRGFLWAIGRDKRSSN